LKFDEDSLVYLKNQAVSPRKSLKPTIKRNHQQSTSPTVVKRNLKRSRGTLSSHKKTVERKRSAEYTDKEPKIIPNNGSVQYKHNMKTAYSTLKRKQVQSYLQVEVCFGIRKQLQFGEQMLLTGNLQELGKWSLPLVLHSNETNSFHSINLTLPRNCKLEYKYLLRTNDVAIWERGRNRHLIVDQCITGIFISDEWQERDSELPIQSIKLTNTVLSSKKIPIRCRVRCNHIKRDNITIRIVGNSTQLGEWKPKKAPKMLPVTDTTSIYPHDWFEYCFEVLHEELPLQFKYVACGKIDNKMFTAWEGGYNHQIDLDNLNIQLCLIFIHNSTFRID